MNVRVSCVTVENVRKHLAGARAMNVRVSWATVENVRKHLAGA
jgi:hypothetical protein